MSLATEEFEGELRILRQTVKEQQAKIHEMVLKNAALETRLRSINEISGGILKRLAHPS